MHADDERERPFLGGAPFRKNLPRIFQNISASSSSFYFLFKKALVGFVAIGTPDLPYPPSLISMDLVSSSGARTAAVLLPKPGHLPLHDRDAVDHAWHLLYPRHPCDANLPFTYAGRALESLPTPCRIPSVLQAVGDSRQVSRHCHCHRSPSLRSEISTRRCPRHSGA